MHSAGESPLGAEGKAGEKAYIHGKVLATGTGTMIHIALFYYTSGQ